MLRDTVQGQCGYGTSLEVIAAQRRQEWAIGAHFAASMTAAEATAEEATEGTGGAGSASQQQRQRQVPSSGGWQTWLKPLEQHEARQQELDEAKRCRP